MRLTQHPVIRFDRFLPIYNWLYPLSGRSRSQAAPGDESFPTVATPKGRALYFHVPFCETICSFCPFVRGRYRDASVVDAYVAALLKEIEIKSLNRSLTAPPIRAIFFGGGTPSLLEPHHIQSIGRTIAQCFDLRELTEFSFEVEVKSVTDERLAAMREIGVTHARFGLQTFSPEYRALFTLTATIEQIERATHALLQAFPNVSADILYGMSGQSVEALERDIDGVCELGLTNVDLYPINNVMTQHRLHRALAAAGKSQVSGLTKFYMSIFIRAAMRERGFLPHNGHGYVRVPVAEAVRDPVVTDLYSFVYHEHVYGCQGFDLLGFGTNAVSSFSGYTVFNTASRSQYIARLSEGALPISVRCHSHEIDACRPVALALPYHGRILKSDVEWDAVPAYVRARLATLVDAGLVLEDERGYALSHEGWQWYSSIMYYLMPTEERRALDAIVLQARQDARRVIEPTGLEGLSLNGAGG
jgi:anaerobilin synthase